MRRDVGQGTHESHPQRGGGHNPQGRDGSVGPSNDWEMQVPPAPINTALTWMLSGEAALSRRVPMPVGSSVLVVARK